jgi:hypothetical protein
MSSKTSDEYIKKRSERRQKKTDQQSIRRLQGKRKRSLVSLLSASSISSTFDDRGSSFGENNNEEQSNLSQHDNSTSISTLITGTFNGEQPVLLSDTESDIVINMSSSSTSTASSCTSDDISSEDEVDTMDMNLYLPDHQPLHSFTSATVCQFSFDLLEFCRISHLPDKQRSHLLELFQKYLPSPNMVPNSSEKLLGKSLFLYIFSSSNEYSCIEYY